jgi:lipopolysaccharide export system ATP-binding protein
VEENIMAVLEMTQLSTGQREKTEPRSKSSSLTHVARTWAACCRVGNGAHRNLPGLGVDPKFVLLDEPFAGVDPLAVEEIQIIVARLKTKNIGILITDHNVNETLSITDRAYLLTEGKILTSGIPEDIVKDERVRKAYLGESFEFRKKRFKV